MAPNDVLKSVDCFKVTLLGKVELLWPFSGV